MHSILYINSIRNRITKLSIWPITRRSLSMKAGADLVPSSVAIVTHAPSASILSDTGGVHVLVMCESDNLLSVTFEACTNHVITGFRLSNRQPLSVRPVR